MDVYGMGARLHMERYGTTQRQLAVISSKNHYHGSLNPMAQYQKTMSVEEVLEDSPVSYPLTRSMCAPIGDGAAAAILCSERMLKKYPDAKPVRIRASVLASGALPDSGLEPIARRLSKRAYEQAGLGPEDIDVAEVHDATAFGELLQCEELGFCPEGGGGPLAESGDTTLGGRLPVNTSGGLECRGHPIGASGLAQIHELVTAAAGRGGRPPGGGSQDRAVGKRRGLHRDGGSGDVYPYIGRLGGVSAMSMTAVKERTRISEKDPKPDVTMCSLISGKKLPRAMIRETKKAIALARRFNEEVVEPRALELDLKKMEDPDYLPWDLVEEANRRGFFTLFEPKIFGGQGINLPAMSYFSEELASSCVGIANLVAVHYLGVATLVATWNVRLMNRLMRDAAEGERTGKPCIMAMAITEPAVGTDVCEMELLNKSDAAFRIERVDGGYLLNGMKHFISNGHFATWNIVFGYEDLKKPAESVVILAVKAGTKGFPSAGRSGRWGRRRAPRASLSSRIASYPTRTSASAPNRPGS